MPDEGQPSAAKAIAKPPKTTPKRIAVILACGVVFFIFMFFVVLGAVGVIQEGPLA